MTGSNALLVPPEVPRVLDPDELYRQLMQIVGRDAGLRDWGSNIYHTSYESGSEFAHTIQNQGTGGHLNIPGLLAVTDSGVAMGPLSVTNLLVSGTLGVTGTSTLGVVNSGALTSSGLVQGTRLISTVATGTAPLTVTSTTKVANLNADFLDGFTSADFALTSDLANYVAKAGDTMTGALQVRGGNSEVSLKVQYANAVGVFSIGASNAADPVMRFRDNSGDLTFEVGNNASSYQAKVYGALNVTGTADITGDAIAARAVINGTTFSGSEELRIVGQTRAEGQVVVTTGGVDVTGSSDFQSATTFHNGISVSAGNVFFPNTTTGFFGSGGATKQAVGAAATDPATTMALANAIRNALQNLGLSS